MLSPGENRASLAGLRSAGAANGPELGGVTLSIAVLVVPLNVPEIVADFVIVTALVVMVKFALSAPAATVTLEGVAAAGSLLESVTTAPPDGAAAVKVTVPVEEFPPATLVGLMETAESAGPEEAPAFIVRVAL